MRRVLLACVLLWPALAFAQTGPIAPSAAGTVTFTNTTLAVTGTFWQATQPVSHSNFANLDAALSTLATQATLALIKAKTDNLDALLSTLATTAKQPTLVSGRMPVDGSGVTQPVSGTFWQATQPVSGTFFQVTQPVSLASLPALAAGSAVIGHVIADTGSTTAVTGTVTVSDGSGALNVIVDSATLGTVTVSDGSGSLNTILDSGTLTTITNPVTVTDGAGSLNVIVDSGTVTANAGSNLNTSLLALETTQTLQATASKQDTGNTSLGTINTNTAPLVVSGGGGYVRQDSTATMAKETGGNLATVNTNTAPLVASGAGGYVRQDSTATIAKESGGNLATIATNSALQSTAANQTTELTSLAAILAQLVTTMATTGTATSTASTSVQGSFAATPIRVTPFVSPFPLLPCNPVRRTNCAK